MPHSMELKSLTIRACDWLKECRHRSILASHLGRRTACEWVDRAVMWTRGALARCSRHPLFYPIVGAILSVVFGGIWRWLT